LAITVTAQATGGTANGILLRVYALDGAALAGSPVTGTQSGPEAHEAAVTPSQDHSVIWGALLNGYDGETMPLNSGCTAIDNILDTTNDQNYATFSSSTGAAGAGTPKTVGSVASYGGGMACLEVIPAVAGTAPATDAGSPAAADSLTADHVTTASFTPGGSASYLIALVSANGEYGGTTGMTISDSAGHTWTQQASANTESSGYAGVWTAPLSATPAASAAQTVTPVQAASAAVSGSVTVTATSSGPDGLLLRVLVLDNAAVASSPQIAVQSGAAAHQASITTTPDSSSIVYGAIFNADAATVPMDPFCTAIDNITDAVNGCCYATFTSDGTGAAQTVGTDASYPGGMAACEILAAGGNITTDDSSPPAVHTAAAQTVTTTAFSPPPGTLLVALVSANGAAAAVSVTLSGGGLTWTRQAAAAAAGQRYAAVFTATSTPGVMEAAQTVTPVQSALLQVSGSGYVTGSAAQTVTPVQAASAAVTGAGQQQMMVSAYVPTGTPAGISFWASLIGSAPQVGIIIFNVDSGPGTGYLAAFGNLISEATAAGIRALGYVWSDYGRGNVAAIEAQVAQWYEYYGASGLAGILYDGGPYETGSETYYQELCTYVHSNHPGSTCAVNPGVPPPQSYFALGYDIIQVCEDSDANFPGDAAAAPSWLFDYPATMLAVTVNSCAAEADMVRDIGLAKTAFNAHWVWVTSDDIYAAEPPYFAAEVALLTPGPANASASQVVQPAQAANLTVYGPAPVPAGFSSVPGISAPGAATPGYPQYTPPAPPVPQLVQQIKGSSYAEYGLHAVEITTTAGNGIVVYAGWDRNLTPSPAPVPACYVSDSAGNQWYHLGTSDAGNSGARASVWYTPGWQAVEWVSVSLTGFAASLAYLVAEFTGLPALCVPSVSVTTSSPAVTTAGLTVTGDAPASGPAFAVLAAGSATAELSTAPAGWSALEPVTAGGSAADSVQIWPYFLSASGAGTVTAEYGITTSAPMAGVVSVLEASPAAPVLPNPAFPLLSAGLGFGFLPGDVSAAPPVWTDVTSRCITPEGGAWIDYSYGHEYELASSEAGTLSVMISNTDGALTPGNPASAYWSNALTGNPSFQEATGIAAQTTGTTAGWSAQGNAALGTSGTYIKDSSWSAQVTPDGLTASPGLVTSLVPVWSTDYCASAWVYIPQGGTAQAVISWYAGSVYSSQAAGTPVTVPAGQWTQVTARASAPPGVTAAAAGFQIPGTPAAAVVSFWDTAGLCYGGQTVQADCVRDLCPVRVSAYWDGIWYDVASGYVQAWPAEWPDLPQFGLSRMRAADSIAVMASCTMPSAMQGEILIDSPYAYLPCGEQYLTSVNGLSTSTTTLQSYEFAAASYLPAANYSRVNQRAGMYVQAHDADPVQTGLALNLLGDQGTGMGTTSYAGNPGAGAGPGVVYADPGLPSPAVTSGQNGTSVECWFLQDDTSQPVLLTAAAHGSPYLASAPPELLGSAFTIIANGGLSQVAVFLPGTALTAAYTASPGPQHLALTFVPVASVIQPAPFWSVQLWLNGVLAAEADVIYGTLLQWAAVILGPARYAFGAVPFRGNYVLGHAAVHSAALSPSRVRAHHRVGAYGTTSGSGGDTPQQRVAAILSWGYLGIPRGGPLTYAGATENLYLGPAYDVGGSTAIDAVNTVTTSEGGLAACMPNGVLTYLPRNWLYNLPSAVTFGDDPAAGEVPFLRGQAWDLDTTYLYDQTAVTRVSGATTSVTATWRDSTGAARYFTRSALTQQIETTSDDDAYDASTWLAAKYAEPSLRVRTLTIDAASNPVQAFPAVLATRQGTVATVNRRPVGGAPVSTLMQVQKVTHRIGPGKWQVTCQLSPYVPDSSVLQADAGLTLGGVSALPR
jgi:hypothetical protein